MFEDIYLSIIPLIKDYEVFFDKCESFLEKFVLYAYENWAI